MNIFSAKYRFFKQKMKAVQCTIWEAEFKLTKSRMIREGVRQDRDRAIEAIQQVDARILGEKDEKNKEGLAAEKAKLEADVKRYEAQMKMVDKQINGFQGTDTEESVIGLLEQIRSYVELRQMYAQHLQNL